MSLHEGMDALLGCARLLWNAQRGRRESPHYVQGSGLVRTVGPCAQKKSGLNASSHIATAKFMPLPSVHAHGANRQSCTGRILFVHERYTVFPRNLAAARFYFKAPFGAATIRGRRL